MKILPSFLSLLALTVASFFFVTDLKPSSTGAFIFFFAWLSCPYAVIAVLLFLKRKDSNLSFLRAASFILPAAAAIILLDTIYWHPDAQGGLGVLMIPFMQGILAALLAIIMARFGKRKTETSHPFKPQN